MRKAIRGIVKAGGYIFLLALVSFCGVVNLVNAPQKSERDRRARVDALELISALEGFRSEAGRYPDDLSELVPQYLSEVPSRAGGGPFLYQQLIDTHGFTLGYFDAPMGTLPSDGYHIYDSSSKEWTFKLL